MATKMDLKPAKPILKPYYTLEAAFERLVSLGADLTEPSDLLLLAQHEKITILVLLTDMVSIVSPSDIISISNLSSSEKEMIQKELLDKN